LAVDAGGAAPVDAGTEEPVRRFVQRVLRGGLAVAVALMTAGVVVKLAAGGDAARAVRLFRLGRRASAGDTLMAAGILVLALTPAFRVLSLIVLWARERDWRYVGVAVVVLIALLTAVAVGHG
jgi:uncharacterized membrane protein